MLRAGYQLNIPVIFIGNIFQCFSVREGPNFITQIEAFDGGYAYTNAYTNLSASQTNQKTVVTTLFKDLQNVGIKLGACGTINGTTGRGNSYSGPTCSMLSELTNQKFFIDNNQAFVLADYEYIPTGSKFTINAETGLLSTPVLEQTILHFDMLFEPSLRVGQKIYLESANSNVPKGDYKVVSIQHRGMISEAVCGEAISNVGLYANLNNNPLVEVPLLS